MKKLALAVLVAVPLLASAQSGYYVQGDVGYSRLKIENSIITDNEVSYGVSVGKNINGARFAVDYTDFGSANVRATDQAGAEVEFKVKTQSVGVSAIYDFKNDTAVTPYLGARVSATRLGYEASFSALQGRDTDHETDIGVGAVAGVQVQVAPQVALDAAVEYNHLGKSKYFNKGDVSQYGATVGVRVDF